MLPQPDVNPTAFGYTPPIPPAQLSAVRTYSNRGSGHQVAGGRTTLMIPDSIYGQAPPPPPSYPPPPGQPRVHPGHGYSAWPSATAEAAPVISQTVTVGWREDGSRGQGGGFGGERPGGPNAPPTPAELAAIFAVEDAVRRVQASAARDEFRASVPAMLLDFMSTHPVIDGPQGTMAQIIRLQFNDDEDQPFNFIEEDEPRRRRARPAFESERATKDPLTGELMECVICMEAIELASEVHKIQCVHRFHAACLTEWASRKDSCPSCRADLYPRDNFGEDDMA